MRPVWLEQSEQGREGGGDGKEVTGTECAETCGPQGGLGFLPHGRWEPWRAMGSRRTGSTKRIILQNLEDVDSGSSIFWMGKLRNRES